MKHINAWLTTQPSWLWILLALFFVKGLLIAAIGPAWYGEDEPSHFGYIEALARQDVWYSFRDNFASIDTRLAHRLMDITVEPQWALELLDTPEYRSYRAYAAHHKNATAYQAPLFYWLLSRVYGALGSWNIVSVLYLMRFINVALGTVYVLVLYLISKQLFSSENNRLIMTGLASNIPLLSLLAATVTVQITVFLLYGLLMLVLLQKNLSTFRQYGLSIAIVTVGLLVQQAFLVSPLIVVAVLVYEVVTKKVTKKDALIVVAILTVALGMVAPQLYRRHAETRYTLTRGREPIRDMTPVTYVVMHAPRLKKELVDSFWDQNRSMVPYYASDKAINALMLITSIASIGFLHWLSTQRHHRRVKWLVIAGVTAMCFIGGHLVFDYRVTKYSGQEYLKARYFYPLLPIIIWSWMQGLEHLFKGSQWYRPLIITYITILCIAQGTAIAWLILALQNR